ncbi:hypothetical protein DF182_05610 [Chitinophaga flava]|uniref:Uncharacterized protein n=1 Tax=Chitinophaga flava TaxID=2259036 RepID=A0A365Y1G1_9BACT|nr:hypothetical protein DF182_05610 [Chitinophaga flava]
MIACTGQCRAGYYSHFLRAGGDVIPQLLHQFLSGVTASIILPVESLRKIKCFSFPENANKCYSIYAIFGLNAAA